MKKATKILALATVLSMSLSLVNVHAAQTTTKIFEEDFNDWTAATTDYVKDNYWSDGGYTGNKIALVDEAEGDKALGFRSGVSIIKNFKESYDGLFGVSYTAKVSDKHSDKNGADSYVESVMELTLQDVKTGRDRRLHIQFGNKQALLYLRDNGAPKAWNYISQATVLEGEIDVTVRLNLDEKTFKLEAKDKENHTFTYEKGLEDDYKVKSMMFGASGDGTVYEKNESDSWTATTKYKYTTVDDIAVYQRDIPNDELTYLNKDFTDWSNDFFGGNLYDGWKYAADNYLKGQTAASDTTGNSLLTFENGKMKVNVVKNSNDRLYNAIIPLSETLTDGIAELSFKAQQNVGSEFAMVKAVASDDKELTSLWIKDGTVTLNHQYDNSAQKPNGSATPVKNAEGEHSYKLIINIDEKTMSVYYDGQYKGQYNIGLHAYQGTNLSYIALANIVIDDLVVKKAPLMTQYNYYGLRKDRSEELGDTWNAQWNETSENQYGHFMKCTTTDFWYSQDFGTKLTVSNPTGLDKNVMVVSAIYDADGRLYSVAMSDVKTLNKKSEDDAQSSELTTFDVKHEGLKLPQNTASFKFKTFLFDSIDSLTPVGEAIAMPTAN